MATQVIGKQEMHSLNAPDCSFSLARLAEGWEAEDLEEDEAQLFAPARALRGARGILFALGLEGGVLALGFFLWQMIRTMR